MNIVWIWMIICSTVYAVWNGNAHVISDVIFSVGESTFHFVVPLICMTAFFQGILSIAKEAGIILKFAKIMKPLLKRLFPDLKDDDEALGYISGNIVANLVGLANGATPLGLKAMQKMQEHNPNKDIATRSMITFLIMNTAGITLFSSSLIAIRNSFHSKDVMGFIPYAFLTSLIACVIALIVDRMVNYRE